MSSKKEHDFEREQKQSSSTAERMKLQLHQLKYQKLNPLEEVEGILTLLAFHLAISVEDVPYLLTRMANEKNRKVDKTAQDSIFQTEAAQKIQAVFASLNRNWQSFATTKLRLINLPKEVKKALRKDKIEYTKALKLGTVKDKELRHKLLRNCIRSNWSMSKLKREVDQAQLVQTLI
jgi:ParB family chromosome partitioning protein